MARYLAYTSPARGHLYPIVATLLELRERGHDVYVRTLASEVAVLEELGLHAAEIAAAIEDAPLDDWEGSTPQEGLARALATFAERAKHEVPDLEAAIADVNPDVVLVDITTVGAAAVAEAASLPWAQTIPLFQHFSFAGPSTDVSLVPFTIDPSGIEVLNAPRRLLGLPPLAGAPDVWRAPVHLYYTAHPFESSDFDFPPSFRLVGPGIWEPPAEVPEWLDDLKRPLVLVSASSEFQRDDALIQTALQALGSEDVDVVITTAAHDPDRFEGAANAKITRWLPHGPFLRSCVCGVPRRYGHHPESPRGRRPRLYRPVRARSVRGRRTRD